MPLALNFRHDVSQFHRAAHFPRAMAFGRISGTGGYPYCRRSLGAQNNLKNKQNTSSESNEFKPLCNEYHGHAK